MTENNICGSPFPFRVSPLVPAELPKITFDPQRKCTWASETYRAEQNAWLLERFGSERVAFFVNTKHLFGDIESAEIFVSPKHVAMLKGFT